MHIQLAEFTFHGGDIPGDTGFTVAAAPAGWTGGPGRRRETISRPLVRGSFDSVGASSDLSVTWGGTYHGSSLADVMHMGRALTGLEGVDERVKVVVDWEDNLWAWARVDRVRFVPHGSLPRADYQVELWLPDPVKFGDLHTWTVAANVASTIHHYGNFQAAPRFIVRGPQPAGYSITATGKPSFQVNASLGTSSVDVVDFATGRVYRNGSLLVGFVSFPRTWTVPGGGQQTWTFAGTGAGTCTAELTDTFI